MLKTIKRYLHRWLSEDYLNVCEVSSMAVEEQRLWSEGIRFQLYRANGGFIIETRTYDRKTDRPLSGMYVITENQDIGKELGKIITMECLK